MLREIYTYEDFFWKYVEASDFRILRWIYLTGWLSLISGVYKTVCKVSQKDGGSDASL